MMIDDYKPNSKAYKNELATTDKKKVEKPVVTGAVKTKKKNGFSKFISEFIAEDIPNIGDYIRRDVIIPTIKKTILESVDMFLFGSSSRRSTLTGSKISYRDFYYKKDEPRTTTINTTQRGYSYEDISLDSRSDAEAVLSQMNDIIDEYGFVSVADLYDCVGISGDYTDNKYGWSNIATADVVRARDGRYELRLPKAMPRK